MQVFCQYVLLTTYREQPDYLLLDYILRTEAADAAAWAEAGGARAGGAVATAAACRTRGRWSPTW